MLKRAALGFRAHSGWAALVVLGEGPTVIDRRRIPLAGSKIPGAMQPYHAAAQMKLEDAGAYLERCASSAGAVAQAAMREAIGELRAKGYSVTGAAVLMGSGRPARELAGTLASHPLIHTAEGEFFRDAVKRACESQGLLVLGVKEKEVLTETARALGISTGELTGRLSELGKPVGRPWRQDEKLCAAAAWLLLA